MLGTAPKDNVANQPLSFFISAGDKDPLLKDIEESKDLLKEKRFPVIFREMKESGQGVLRRRRRSPTSSLARLARPAVMLLWFAKPQAAVACGFASYSLPSITSCSILPLHALDGERAGRDSGLSCTSRK